MIKKERLILKALDKRAKEKILKIDQEDKRLLIEQLEKDLENDRKEQNDLILNEMAEDYKRYIRRNFRKI